MVQGSGAGFQGNDAGCRDWGLGVRVEDDERPFTVPSTSPIKTINFCRARPSTFGMTTPDSVFNFHILAGAALEPTVKISDMMR